MKDKLADDIRLKHIFECMDEIETALKNQTCQTFIENHVLRIAVVKWLEIIGEAGNHISQETKNRNKSIEWRGLIDLRNFFVHEYFGINYEDIWETATILLKDLRVKLEAINLDLNDNFLTN